MQMPVLKIGHNSGQSWQAVLYADGSQCLLVLHDVFKERFGVFIMSKLFNKNHHHRVFIVARVALTFFLPLSPQDEVRPSNCLVVILLNQLDLLLTQKKIRFFRGP